MRRRIVTKELDLCSPNSVERKYWVFLRDMIEKLNVLGMSSDESEIDEVTKEKVGSPTRRRNEMLMRKGLPRQRYSLEKGHLRELGFH